ncbi:Src homology-3 domain [Pseudocohnilembus persalinus]|uniref:Src homology-3 domain n=1 Tax=Pseudocohnilembus persalinus TaxID=266149 RepID=A0A0V0QY11_PSEPJ|nr:Src homology-3 domain [Pseudocohnilembus persalinus]|eukprot:KRX07122.1 Src homology-3 domain [Pseudocohnilembus persalinus]
MFAKAIADFSGDLMLQQQQQQQQQDSSTQQDQEQQQQQVKYLNFNANDSIYIKHQFENGWWYGCVYKEGVDIQNLENDGYLPSNYVKPVEIKKPKIPPPPKEPSQSDLQDKDIDYKEYAKQLIEKEKRKQLIHYYAKSQSELELAKQQLEQQKQLEEQQMLQQKMELEKLQAENRMTEYNKRQSEFQQQQMEKEFGVSGYKKIKITAENKESLVNNPQIRFDDIGEYAYVSVKDQSLVSKAYRQMNHYFDYDKWNDQMNQQKQKKGKPDPNKKKDMKAQKMNKLLNMFWGSELTVNKGANLKIDKEAEDQEVASLHITNAVLDPQSRGKVRICVKLNGDQNNVNSQQKQQQQKQGQNQLKKPVYDKNSFVIATLQRFKKEQQKLDLYFHPSQNVSFFIQAEEKQSTVHLSGYFEMIENEDDEDMYSDDYDEDEISELDEEEQEEFMEPENFVKKGQKILQKQGVDPKSYKSDLKFDFEKQLENDDEFEDSELDEDYDSEADEIDSEEFGEESEDLEIDPELMEEYDEDMDDTFSGEEEEFSEEAVEYDSDGNEIEVGGKVERNTPYDNNTSDEEQQIEEAVKKELLSKNQKQNQNNKSNNNSRKSSVNSQVDKNGKSAEIVELGKDEILESSTTQTTAKQGKRKGSYSQDTHIERTGENLREVENINNTTEVYNNKKTNQQIIKNSIQDIVHKQTRKQGDQEGEDIVTEEEIITKKVKISHHHAKSIPQHVNMKQLKQESLKSQKLFQQQQQQSQQKQSNNTQQKKIPSVKELMKKKNKQK